MKGDVLGHVIQAVDASTGEITFTCTPGLLDPSTTWGAVLVGIGTNSEIWWVVVPTTPYTSLHPTGTLTWECNGHPLQSGTLQDSWATAAIREANHTVYNATSFWGIDSGQTYPNIYTYCNNLPIHFTYSGDANYDGFDVGGA